MSDVKCPYCGEEHEIDRNYDEGEPEEEQCGSCDETFSCEMEIEYNFSAIKMECSKGDHKWQHKYHTDREDGRRWDFFRCKEEECEAFSCEHSPNYAELHKKLDKGEIKDV